MTLLRSAWALLIMSLALGYWLAIFTATHLPARALPHSGGNDKLQHAAAFAGLAILLCLAASMLGRSGSRVFLVILLLGAIYGAFDEVTQHFIPGRTADFWDWLADFAGLLLGIGLFQIAQQLIRGNDRKNLDASGVEPR